MQFNMLGPFGVTGERGPIDLGSTKQRAVLAMLTIEANRIVSIDRLVDQLWGDDPPRSAVGSLHAYVSNLRRALEPDRPPRSPSRTLVSRDPGYVLVVEPDQVDALRFERLVTEASSHVHEGQPAAALSILNEALALWRGPVLADFGYDPFVEPAARRLEELRRAAAEDRADALLALGHHAAVVADLEELIAADPLRERTWAQLMVALYRCGRQADALRAYQRARVALVDELGIDPGPALRALEQAVLAQDPDLQPPAGATVAALPRSWPDTPAQGSTGDGHGRLIGRDRELGEVDDALASLARGRGGLVVVSGEPGVGKTSLLDTLADRAEAAGFAVGRARPPEGATAPALWPWVEALRRIDEVVSLRDALTPMTAFDDLLSRLRKLARERPVVIILDDLQWADELSDQFLEFVIAAAHDEPLLVAVGLRDPFDDPSDALLAATSAMTRDRSARRIALSGLDRRDVGALAARVSGDAPSEAVVDALYRRTSGNPFFVTELVRLLRAEHALHDLDRMKVAGVPQGARDVIRRRLTRLPEQAATLLSVAAVLGRRIDTRLVEQITSVSTDELLDLLELATVAGLLIEEPAEPGVYRFNHDLVREALYDGLPGLRRARLHAQAVDAILAVRGDTPAVAHELARHAVAAVPHTGPDPAVPRLAASAQVAQRQLAIDFAERQLRQALSLVADAADTPARRRIEAGLETRLAAMEFHNHGNGPSASRRLQRARDICPRDDANDYLRIVLWQGAIAGLWGEIDAAISAATEAIAVARELGDRLAESDAEYCRGLLDWAGAAADGLVAVTRAVTIAEALEGESGAPTVTHVPLGTKRALRSIALAVTGALDDAGRERRAAMTRAERDGGWTLTWSAAFAAFSAVLSGEPEEVVAIADGLPEQARGLAYTDALLGACRRWALTVVANGDIAAFDLERERLMRAGDKMFAAAMACLAADLRLDRGDIEGAHAELASARTYAASTGATTWLPEIDRLLVRAGLADAAVLTAALETAEAAGAGLFAARIRGLVRP